MAATSDIERGRELCAERAWAAAYSSLSAIDPVLLSAGDLELLAGSAFMLGRDDAYVGAREFAYHSHLEAGDPARAALCTWWIGDYLRFRGDSARATGWFARGHSLLDGVGEDCVARGFLLLPTVHDYVSVRDHEAAFAVASEAGEIGARFGDRDLIVLAMMERGHALVRQGNVAEGWRLVDETMVLVTTEELSPIIAGIVHCSTIAFCQGVFELGRAQAWTEAHTAWCERQSDMRAYMGPCLVHRAEIMTLAGDWSDAMGEVRRAESYTQGVVNERIAGQAAYRRGDVHLLRGDLDSAEEAYREASRRGREPQPGLALLRLAQGDGEAAAASLRRALSEYTEPLKRAALLPAYIEIMVAVGDPEGHAPAAAISRTPPSARAAARSPRWQTTRAARSSWQAGTPGTPWSRCAEPVRHGRSSGCLARPHVPACWWGRHVRRWATRIPPPWSWRRQPTPSRGWERHRSSHGSNRSSAAWRIEIAMG